MDPANLPRPHLSSTRRQPMSLSRRILTLQLGKPPYLLCCTALLSIIVSVDITDTLRGSFNRNLVE
jgi:hypothetical protein